jgi:O-succinylhomoserine sulfhydrylase
MFDGGDDGDGSKGAQPLKPGTILVRGGTRRSGHKETSEALYLTSGFVYDSAEEAEARFAGTAPGYLYGRYANPTNTMLEDRLALLEGAEACRLTASGMAAVTASLMCCLQAGDHVVAGRSMFSSCRWVIETFLPRFGVSCTLVDGPDLEAWSAAMRPQTRAVFIETPSNPTMELIDIAAVCALARASGALAIVDNIFATPLLQRPLELGADVVVYSTTKHMDGQGRTLGGAVLGPKAWVESALDPYLRHTGPAMSPFVAWNVLKGLETMELRVARAVDSAGAIAAVLEADPAIAAVRWPGLASHPQAGLARRQMRSGGTLLAFDLKGGKPAAFAFLDALKVFDISNNLGDAKSLATHPATTTHRLFEPDVQAQLGITQGLVRLSVGIEATEDLVADVKQALAAAASA